MKGIIESLNAKILQEKLTNLSKFKFEVPIEEIFELPKKAEISALSFITENKENSGKISDEPKFAMPAAKNFFGSKPNLAGYVGKKANLENPFAKQSTSKICENFIKNKDKEKNQSLPSSEKAEKTGFFEAKSQLEDLDLNESEFPETSFLAKSQPNRAFLKKRENLSFYFAENFSPKSDLLKAHENKKNSFNLKFNNYNNNNDSNEKNNSQIKNNLDVFRLNEKNNLLLQTNLISIDTNNLNFGKNANSNLSLVTNSAKQISNPFKEKVKLLFNKRNSSAQSEIQASNPFERLAQVKPENGALSLASQETNFNSLFTDPFKYKGILLQSIRME